ncbi:ferredoxin--NADP reductase [Tunicatimonas pelagia]|uniref:ferredoxin--NADP reductase n=1 Tax=Tunicatimonas pelagia TaxID=931531 RepID=UPI002666AEF4|nr:ferredoxin--NADP reductase [Tunicatimonas pelagia]WKN45485.1 ferredoxin--NADP reductase [Tunicatimonas pelagia]
MKFNIFSKSKSKEEPEVNTPTKKSRSQELAVKEIIRETSDAVTIVFDQPDLIYKPGQFLTLILDINGEEVRRSYSLSTSPSTDEYPAVTVKRVASGKASNYLNNTLQPGSTIKVQAPAGTFTTEPDPSQSRHLVMFGGGSGITPLMSLIKSVLEKEPMSKVSLIYANRDKEAIIFREHLHQLESRMPERFHLAHVLENMNSEFTSHGGLITPERVPELLADLPFSEDKTEYFMCGPQGMMENVQQALNELDVPPSLIHKESFVAATPAKKEETAAETSSPSATWDTETTVGALGNDKIPVTETHEVTIIFEGETHRFAVDPDSTILETAIALDIDLPYSCQSGICTACMGKCISGRMKLDETDALTEDDLKEGYVLTCVGHPLTSDVTIEID